MNIIEILAGELAQPEQAVKNVIELIDAGNTIPFIARYRKEAHGAMDDTTLRKLEERLKYLRGLEARKEEILSAIETQGKLSEDIRNAILAARTLSEVEELYKPFKQKKRTRASIAREKGLEPLALKIYEEQPIQKGPEELASDYVDPDKGVETVQEALAGASDIIAERIANTPDFRQKLRELIYKTGEMHSNDQEQAAQNTKSGQSTVRDGSVYDLYKDFCQPIAKMKDHQVLALNRGEKEGFLKVTVEADREQMLVLLEREVFRSVQSIRSETQSGVSGTVPAGAEGARIVRQGNEKRKVPTIWQQYLQGVIADSYDRLLSPSLKNEIRSSLTEKASEGAIHNFALNLKPLLLQPPVKGKVTMGLDPGYRMGCKVAVVDATGKVLDTTVVYPTHGERQKEEAIRRLSQLIHKYGVEHIAIGNGTASRETEQMTAQLLRGCPGVSYMVVSEAGASVYSASPLAAAEFPDYDVNLRSAISIARRLQDPLAELVKIDPKSIGVGQYQHDVPQKRLEESLDGVVEDCVNSVGVDVNTASASLLTRVAGLNGTTAQNIIAFREENGPYTSRGQLKKVPRLGPRAYEQCAGFLRVPESKNILDHTAVHPESYDAAKKLLEIAGFKLTGKSVTTSKKDTIGVADAAASVGKPSPAGTFADLPARIKSYGESKAAQECGIGLPTLRDIIEELKKPGRDPRENLPAPIFRTDLLELKDLKPGMVLTGTVRNVIDFGAFVDIGVHQDGLVHISEIADRYIRHPSEVLSVGEDVKVKVLDVDEKKKRISLSIRQAQ